MLIIKKLRSINLWKFTLEAFTYVVFLFICRRRSRGEEEAAGVAEEGQQQAYGGRETVDEEEEIGNEEGQQQSLQNPPTGNDVTTNGGGEDHVDVNKRVAAVQVQVQGMEGDWRAYCEHPLSVATAAMLNLQQQHQVSAVASHTDDPAASYVYEYYKLPDKTTDVKLPPPHELWSAWVFLFVFFSIFHNYCSSKIFTTNLSTETVFSKTSWNFYPRNSAPRTADFLHREFRKKRNVDWIGFPLEKSNVPSFRKMINLRKFSCTCSKSLLRLHEIISFRPICSVCKLPHGWP